MRCSGFGLIFQNRIVRNLLLNYINKMAKFLMSFLRVFTIFLVALFIMISGAPSGFCALLWKDDFDDDLIHELTWDVKNTTGTAELKNKHCILKIDAEKNIAQAALITLPSRSLPPNFHIACGVEFSNVDGDKGEFYIRAGGVELVVSFENDASVQSDGNKSESLKHIYIRDAISKKNLRQTSGAIARLPHKISSGERYYISWMSNGETPAVHGIKIGTGPGDSNVADFLVETKEAIGGRGEVGIRNRLRGERLNSIRAYLFGTATTLVNDWVLF